MHSAVSSPPNAVGIGTKPPVVSGSCTKPACCWWLLHQAHPAPVAHASSPPSAGGTCTKPTARMASASSPLSWHTIPSQGTQTCPGGKLAIDRLLSCTICDAKNYVIISVRMAACQRLLVIACSCNNGRLGSLPCSGSLFSFLVGGGGTATCPSLPSCR